MTIKKRKRLLKLLKRWTKYEIMARLAPVEFPVYGDYFFKKMAYEDKIRKLLWGTFNQVELGERWGLLNKRRKKKRSTDV